jgi:hypothetical protein
MRGQTSGIMESSAISAGGARSISGGSSGDLACSPVGLFSRARTDISEGGAVSRARSGPGPISAKQLGEIGFFRWIFTHLI